MFQKYEPRFGPGGPRPEGELRRKDLTLEDAAALSRQSPRSGPSRRSATSGTTRTTTSSIGTTSCGRRASSASCTEYPIATNRFVAHGPLPDRERRRARRRRDRDRRRRSASELFPREDPIEQAGAARPRRLHRGRCLRAQGEDVRRLAGQLRRDPDHDVRPALPLDQGRRQQRRRPADRHDSLPSRPGRRADREVPRDPAHAPARPPSTSRTTSGS